ncbi:MAG: helix-turn-helix domain-containing protein [Methanobacteriaceae archaeon]|jgi:DNA-binding MarR family transcriptional regulator
MNKKWKNQELKNELMFNALDYLNRKQNVSLRDLADYTGQEYIVIQHLMNDLENQGLIKSETFYNLKKRDKNSK